MKYISLVTLSGLALLSASSFASAKMKVAKNYNQIQTAVQQFKDPRHTLLVLDDDDTLTMMPCTNQKDPNTCQYIGGAAWWGWQDHLPHNSPYRVSKTSSGLNEDAAAIMALNKMTFTDPTIPNVLSKLTQEGVHVIVETARWPSMTNATQMQLSFLPTKINGKESNMSHLFNRFGLKSHAGIPSLASPYRPCGNKSMRMVSYQMGVYYVASQNKGKLLRCLLKRTRSGFVKHIVFADDLKINTIAVYKAFKHNPTIDVTSLYYTRLKRHKAMLIRGMYAHRYQNQARTEWIRIHKTVLNNLQSPAVSY